MRYIVILTLYAYNFLCIAPIRTETHIVKGFLPDVAVLRKFLEQFLRPYAKINYQSNKKRTPHSKIPSLVEKAIEDKIKELKPFLQDNDDKHDSGDKLTLEGKDETTIVEYVTKTRNGNNTENDDKLKKFKENIENYKKMRYKIEELLDKETVPEDTKMTVTKTLDEMIAQLIENQCTWKKIDLGAELFQNRPHTFTSAKELSSKEWLEVKKHYTNLIQNQNIKESLTFLHQSFDFFSKIAKNFNVQCRFVDENDPEDFRRQHGKMKHEYNCDNFTICTKELRKFLNHFYKSLNDSVVAIFTNYAEMYSRDVNTDESHEKNQVIATIKKLSHSIQPKVSKIFTKELKNLTLDSKKNKEANIRALSHFVTDTGNHVMKNVKKHLKRDLKPLGAKKISIINDDLTVNMNMDLGNIEKKEIGKICKVFAVCNNYYIINGKNTKRALDISDSKNVYVKVQLTFDDEMKDHLASRVHEIRLEDGRKVETKRPVTRTTRYASTHRHQTLDDSFNQTKSDSKWKNLFGDGKINNLLDNFFKQIKSDPKWQNSFADGKIKNRLEDFFKQIKSDPKLQNSFADGMIKNRFDDFIKQIKSDPKWQNLFADGTINNLLGDVFKKVIPHSKGQNSFADGIINNRPDDFFKHTKSDSRWYNSFADGPINNRPDEFFHQTKSDSKWQNSFADGPINNRPDDFFHQTKSDSMWQNSFADGPINNRPDDFFHQTKSDSKWQNSFADGPINNILDDFFKKVITDSKGQNSFADGIINNRIW